MIMNNIINAIKITPKEMDAYVEYMTEELLILMKEGDTLKDELNLHIKYFNGVDILKYYIPTNPTKDKDPRLNKTLQQKSGYQRKQSLKSFSWRRKVKLELKIN